MKAPLIAAAVNRYFGYFLVREVRLSAEPFSAGVQTARHRRATPPEVGEDAADEAVAAIGDPGLKAALTGLGAQISARRRQ